MSRSAKDFKGEQSPSSRMNASRIRRLLVSVTSSVFWQLLGPKSHENEGRQGTLDAEVFSGIGFYSRPRTTDKTEAVLASVGDARHSVIIATRNESVRRAIADLQADETAIFTSSATVVIKANGTIELRSAGGTALPLPTLADVQAVVDKLNDLITLYNAHVHTGGTLSGGLTGVADDVTTTDVGNPGGTTVLKGE